MSAKLLSAGDTIEGNCTRCRTVTNHTIVAMVADRPARVQCNTCGGQHNYRPAAAPKKPVARKAAASKAPRQSEWLMRQAEIRAAIPVGYAMQQRFEVGTVIEHPSFGLGLVLAKPGAQKIEVLFEDGKKILRCA